MKLSIYGILTVSDTVFQYIFLNHLFNSAIRFLIS